ncbi:MAG: hypothetical protein DSY50_05810, partial [Desulfobulbus sp.]
RPVCPARPKPENIVIYKSKSAAEKAGCRACLRCRPDLAPGNRFIQPGKDIVRRCLNLMDETFPEHKSIETLATTLGISARHLRRVFAEQLGASPGEILKTQKIHFAKHLLLETRESVSDIAFASGFTSIRRFNEAFKTAYRQTPSQIRTGKHSRQHKGDKIQLSLMILPPYDFASILSFLKRHAAFGIEKVTDRYYERHVPQHNSYATFRVTINKKQDALLVDLQGFKLQQLSGLLITIGRLFDRDHNPDHLPVTSQGKHPGVRVPGCFDPFETAVSIILSQLVSIAQATGKLAALIQRFGSILDKKDVFRFPQPEQLMNAEIEKIGITRAKADAIRAIARLVHEQKIIFSYGADFARTRKQLLAIKGIGPWTTEIMMMRCFGDPDAFPENDLFIKRALAQHSVDENLWKTHRAYMTNYIWNQSRQNLSPGKKNG